MEENVIIANIATILTKDIIMDTQAKQPNLCEATNATQSFSLLTDTDDSEQEKRFAVLLRQQKRLKKTKKKLQMQLKRAQTMHKGVGEGKAKQSKKSDSAAKETAKSSSKAEMRLQHVGLNFVQRYDNNEFESFLHVQKASYQRLCRCLGKVFPSGYGLPDVSPYTVYALSMWKLTTDEHFEAIARAFELPLTLCQRIIRRFWLSVSDKYESFIKWPNSLVTQQRTLAGFQTHKLLRRFPELFGIVAIKCLDVYFASEDAEVAVVLQFICNAERQVIDCYVELAQDYSFDNSPIGQTLAWNARTMPNGSYLIGNKCFPLKSYLMRPIEAECFRKDRSFNELLQPAFELAEQTLNMMAACFNALYALEARDLSEVRQIIETICALHNLCLEIKDSKYMARKQEFNNLNWARTTAAMANAYGNEKDVKGFARRSELVDTLAALQKHKNKNEN